MVIFAGTKNMITVFKRASLLVAVAALFFIVPNRAQADDHKISQEKLDQIIQHFDAYVAEGKIAGYTSLVAQDGEIIQFKARGKLDIVKDSDMRKDAIFRIYSMTKPVTGVALMMLYEDGKFKLDDPLSKYLPSFKNPQVFTGVDSDGQMITKPAARETTVRDILRHTGGHTYGIFGESPLDKAYQKAQILNMKDSTKVTVEKIGAMPLMANPGEAWIYSVAVDIQGYLVEVLSGMPFDQFLNERIFKPLGMTDTAFYVPKDKTDRLAGIYMHNEDKQLIPVNNPGIHDYTIEPNFKSGGGGLASTTMDYFKFSQMLLNGGTYDGMQILKPETLAMMTTNQLPDSIIGINDNKHIGFGLGFGIAQNMGDHNPMGNDGVYSWGGMANTIFWVDPKDQLIAIFMTNILPPQLYPFSEEMRALIYGNH